LHTRVATPSASYFLCGTPRTGTNLLTGLLKSTGLAGKPEEYFWRDVMEEWAQAWRAETFRDYLAAVVHDGTTPNGVFGAKVMWAHMDDLLDRLRTLSGGPKASDRAVIERSFPRPRFIWIWRDDAIAQAVSWAKADQTDVWYDHADGTPAEEPDFDADDIRRHVRRVAEHNDRWARWFASNGIEPLRVRYEDLVADEVGVTHRILAFLDVEVPDGLAIEAQTTRQGDALNDEWIERFRGLAAGRGRS
jgi:LPS sulfotransferase NodH